MPHTMLRFPTVKARTGLSRSTIYLRISPRHVSRPRVPRGSCRGLDRGRGAGVAHRADRATPADRAAAGAADGGGGGRVPGAGTHTPPRRERVVDMIRNITVDGEEALAVDTAEELGRALDRPVRRRVRRGARGVRAHGHRQLRHAGHRGRVGLARRRVARGRGALMAWGRKHPAAQKPRVESRRLSQSVCRQAQRADRAGCRAVAETVEARRGTTPEKHPDGEAVPGRQFGLPQRDPNREGLQRSPLGDLQADQGHGRSGPQGREGHPRAVLQV